MTPITFTPEQFNRIIADVHNGITVSDACELAGVEHEAFCRELDPVTTSLLNAPVDNEPLTKEDLLAIERAQADVGSGRVFTVEQLIRELDKEIDP